MRELATQLGKKSQVFGILGNHDKYKMAEVLDHCGVKMLLNESACFEKNGEKIYLTGLEDCHYYGADDISLADSGIDNGAFKIMASHSPERYREIAKAGYSLHLAGHTHGGQVCLPNGLALVTSATVPRRMIKGKWMYHGMVGYTSRGVGACEVGVRYFCPPEMTIITLSNSP
jgi:predicted MPP superfamily phosphohydrolase